MSYAGYGFDTILHIHMFAKMGVLLRRWSRHHTVRPLCYDECQTRQVFYTKMLWEGSGPATFLPFVDVGVLLCRGLVPAGQYVGRLARCPCSPGTPHSPVFTLMSLHPTDLFISLVLRSVRLESAYQTTTNSCAGDGPVSSPKAQPCPSSSARASYHSILL